MTCDANGVITKLPNYQIIKAVFESCENFLGASIVSSRTVGGGSICDSRLLRTDKGNYFLKMSNSPQASAMFEAEAKGLEMLAATKSLKIPEVIFYSSEDNVSFLLMEYIEQGVPTATFWKEFGYGLAELHRESNPFFGLDSDSFIGSLPQRNTPKDNWVDFFILERIQPQIDLAVNRSAIDKDAISKFEKLYIILPEIFPEEKPALIHGDLWNGNFIVTSQGMPAIFDPSVSFAYREMDLAMSMLFGGFDQKFYNAYNEAFPLQNGFENRVEIYQLYYLMVHVNLFGGSYLNAVKSILTKYVG